MEVLDAIQDLPADADVDFEVIKGQILSEQVTITNMTLDRE